MLFPFVLLASQIVFSKIITGEHGLNYSKAAGENSNPLTTAFGCGFNPWSLCVIPGLNDLTRAWRMPAIARMRKSAPQHFTVAELALNTVCNLDFTINCGWPL